MSIAVLRNLKLTLSILSLNLILKDFNNDTYKIEIAFINAKTNKLFGKDVEINFDKNKLLKRNEPRLKGKSITSDKNYTELTKGVFTNCKKREKCPPWQMSAKKNKRYY